MPAHLPQVGGLRSRSTPRAQAKRPRARVSISAALQGAMTLADVTAGFYEFNARLDRQEAFIGGILEAVDTNAKILTSVMSRLLAIEQVAATNCPKS